MIFDPLTLRPELDLLPLSYIFFSISVGKIETEVSLLAEKLKTLSISVKDDKLKVMVVVDTLIIKSLAVHH